MGRFYEIDTLRGIAITLMVIYHFFFALEFFRIIGPISFLKMTVSLLSSIFIFLVGLSITISYSRVNKMSKKYVLKKFTKRGLSILFWGILIILLTKVFIDLVVIFNILILIGLSIIVSYPFLKFKKMNLVFASLVIVIGVILSHLRQNIIWLSWLGFKMKSNYFFGWDFPFFPWFGLVLIGIYVGNSFYPNGKRSFKIKEMQNTPVRLLSFFGRNSLLIYLIHIPIILIILKKLDIVQTLSFFAIMSLYVMGTNSKIKNKIYSLSEKKKITYDTFDHKD